MQKELQDKNLKVSQQDAKRARFVKVYSQTTTLDYIFDWSVEWSTNNVCEQDEPVGDP